jgi:hypothetical protein
VALAPICAAFEAVPDFPVAIAHTNSLESPDMPCSVSSAQMFDDLLGRDEISRTIANVSAHAFGVAFHVAGLLVNRRCSGIQHYIPASSSVSKFLLSLYSGSCAGSEAMVWGIVIHNDVDKLFHQPHDNTSVHTHHQYNGHSVAGSTFLSLVRLESVKTEPKLRSIGNIASGVSWPKAPSRSPMASI